MQQTFTNLNTYNVFVSKKIRVTKYEKLQIYFKIKIVVEFCNEFFGDE
jgi:hypothetical protein